MPISNLMAQARVDYFRDPVAKQADDRAEAEKTQANTGKPGDFFGEDGLTFGDVLDAINPLNHIPIVSDLYASATQSTPSAASRLVGGALMGGPVGFVASLASVIFEQATGTSPVGAVVAALTGPEQPVDVAARGAAPVEEVEALEEDEVASLDKSNEMQLASLTPAAAMNAAHIEDVVMGAKEKAVLDLYGNSAASAHESYRKAQLKPYLRDVNISKTI